MIVPTLCVGMHSSTFRDPTADVEAHGVIARQNVGTILRGK